MNTLGAVSFRPGEIRLTDIRQQTELRADISVRVLALSSRGVPVEVKVGFAQKWSSRGWSAEFACPSCGGACRVLRERHGQFACARCLPRRSPHHQRKNTRAWQQDGARDVATVLVTLLGNSRPGTPSPRKISESAARAENQSRIDVEGLIVRAEATLQAVVELGARAAKATRTRL